MQPVGRPNLSLSPERAAAGCGVVGKGVRNPDRVPAVPVGHVDVAAEAVGKVAEATGRQRRWLQQSGSDQDRPTNEGDQDQKQDERGRPAQTEANERAYAGARTRMSCLPNPVAAEV